LKTCNTSDWKSALHALVADGNRAAFDGDKSPAESADKSAHSKVATASPRWEKCSFNGI
jgi:hypothetical protein